MLHKYKNGTRKRTVVKQIYWSYHNSNEGFDIFSWQRYWRIVIADRQHEKKNKMVESVSYKGYLYYRDKKF